MTHVRTAVVVLACAFVLAACRLDVRVDVAFDADGTGEVAVTGTVDRDVVDQVPGLAGSLVFTDAVDAGWQVEGPTPTEDGGLTTTLRHAFTSVEEAANLLDSLGPPFSDVAIERTVGEDEVTLAVSGSMALTGGFDGFADSELIGATGGTPFGEQLAASGATPQESMSVELALTVPGRVRETSGDTRGGAVVWSAPLDGSTAPLTLRAELGPEPGASWAGPLSVLALVLLVLWIAAGITLAVMVSRARARRRSRPLRRLY